MTIENWIILEKKIALGLIYAKLYTVIIKNNFRLFKASIKYLWVVFLLGGNSLKV